MTIPASQPNFEYAVRQLFRGDHQLNPTVEVDLTPEQESRLDNLTDQDLKALRNGTNAVSINKVQVIGE